VLNKLIPKTIKNEVRRHIDNYVKEILFSKDNELSETSLMKISDSEIYLKQLSSILEKEHNVIPPPPKHLQMRVVGGYVPDFISSGYVIYQDLNCALGPAGKELKDFGSILDFGCGCGRAVRVLKTLMPSCHIYGTDIDEEAIGWLKNNYTKFAEFYVAPHIPPTSFEDNMFDFVSGISVFTHLPEDLQFQWLKELNRITKPNGYLVVSIHGEKFYKDLEREIKDIMKNKGFYYSDFGKNYGASINLPDFYQTAFHSPEYIKREWSKYFEVIDIQALRMGNNQDTVLLRNKM
jgi:SAM-dependent methyltransferase